MHACGLPVPLDVSGEVCFPFPVYLLVGRLLLTMQRVRVRVPYTLRPCELGQSWFVVLPT